MVNFSKLTDTFMMTMNMYVLFSRDSGRGRARNNDYDGLEGNHKDRD